MEGRERAGRGGRWREGRERGGRTGRRAGPSEAGTIMHAVIHNLYFGSFQNCGMRGPIF